MSPRPTAPVSPETVVPALTQATGQLLRRLRAEANPGDLSLSQAATLALLDGAGEDGCGEGGGGMTTADLARAQAIKPQSMGAILAALEQQHLVARARHPTDGRQVIFSLTPQGRDARQQRRAAKHDWLLAAVARLPQAAQRTLLDAAHILRELSNG